MNRAELLTAIKAYAHTMDLGPEDTLIELIEAHIAQEVRAPEMVTYATIDTDATPAVMGNAWALPADFLQVRDVYADISGRRCTLQAVGRDAINSASAAASSVPTYYSIVDGLIEFQPGPGARDITVIYYARPAAMTQDTDTSDLMAAHPGLYFYGGMAQWASVAQDVEQLGIWMARFEQEIARVNAYSWQYNVGSSPTVRGSGNPYSARGARL